MKKITLSIVFILFIFHLTGCKEVEDDTRLLVTGTLVNQLNEPLENVEISILNSSKTLKVGESTTNEEGSFRAVSLSPSNSIAIEFELPESISLPETYSLRNRTITVDRKLYEIEKQVVLPNVQISSLSDVKIIVIDAQNTLDQFIYRFSAEVFTNENFALNDIFQLNSPIIDSKIILLTGSLSINNGIAQINQLLVQNQSVTFEYLNIETEEWQEVILEINESNHEFEIFY